MDTKKENNNPFVVRESVPKFLYSVEEKTQTKGEFVTYTGRHACVGRIVRSDKQVRVIIVRQLVPDIPPNDLEKIRKEMERKAFYGL